MRVFKVGSRSFFPSSSLHAIRVPIHWVICFYFHSICSVAWLRAVITTLQTPLAQKFLLWGSDASVTLLKPSLEMQLELDVAGGKPHPHAHFCVVPASAHPCLRTLLIPLSKINMFHPVPFSLKPQYVCCRVSQWPHLKPYKKYKFYQLASTMPCLFQMHHSPCNSIHLLLVASNSNGRTVWDG